MGDSGAVRFTLLGGDDRVDHDTLVDLYAYPGEQNVVRANAIATLDGGATTAGTSGGLGGAGDRMLFGVLRESADVIVVGAGTARAENYGGARMTAEQRNRRLRRGQGEVPPVALVTRSGVLDHALPVFADTEVPPLVLTCGSVADTARVRLGSGAEVLNCSADEPDRVDLAVALEQLAARGLRRILTEGGPSLLGAFIEADLLDELCVTLAPLLVGGTALRIANGDADVLTRMNRAHVLTDEDGYLYSRYIRAR